jgi:hypothetical protein
LTFESERTAFESELTVTVTVTFNRLMLNFQWTSSWCSPPQSILLEDFMLMMF